MMIHKCGLPEKPPERREVDMKTRTREPVLPCATLKILKILEMLKILKMCNPENNENKKLILGQILNMKSRREATYVQESIDHKR